MLNLFIFFCYENIKIENNYRTFVIEIFFLWAKFKSLFNLIFTVKYIKSVDGLTGCYRGLVPKLCSYTVSTIVCEKTAESIQFEPGTRETYPEDEEERLSFVFFFYEFIFFSR